MFILLRHEIAAVTLFLRNDRLISTPSLRALNNVANNMRKYSWGEKERRSNLKKKGVRHEIAALIAPRYTWITIT